MVVNISVSEKAREKAVNLIKGAPIPGVQNIIAIASGKGGVGKSTVTANLAIALKKMGFKVGLIDADIYGPSIPLMFDIQHAKPITVHLDGKNKMGSVDGYGVKVMSIGFFANIDQAVVWRGAMATKALTQMIHDTHWGELDFLLIDLPPGTGDIHLSMVQNVPVTGSVVVSTPQKVALADCRKGVAMFQMEQINVPVLGILENMSYFSPPEVPENKYYLFGKEGARNLAQSLKVPFLGELPLIQSVREASDVGRMAALQEDTKIPLAFEEIARNIVIEVAKRNENLPPTEIVRITTMAGCSQNRIIVDTLTEKIEKALDEVRPFLANDGGDVSLVNIEGTTVMVQFHGACVGCKVSDFTLKGGIESTIKKYAPEIERVIAVEA